MSSDPWERLQSLTPARIGLGRVGDGVPTRALLDFELAHARARDAVYAELEPVRLIEALSEAMPEHASVVVRSRADSRSTYLQRPDLGASLHPDDETTLSRGDFDVAFVLADGLSATAVHAHGVATLMEATRLLGSLSIAPWVVAQQARVALGDPIGAALGARLIVMLIGERPGLSSPDSLGAYLTFDPRPGRTDAERNCISNIRAGGLPPTPAGARIAALVGESLRRQISGVTLKDRSDASLVSDTHRRIE